MSSSSQLSSDGKHTPSAMAGLKRIAAALAMSIALQVVVMAMVAEASVAHGNVDAGHHAGQDAGSGCDPNALYPCLAAIEGARPPAPSRQCCRVVQSVDKTCMCNQLKSSSFPEQMVHNGLELPKKCGRTDLRGFRCGRECSAISSHPINACCLSCFPWTFSTC